MLKKTFSTLYNLDFRYITSLSMLFSQDFIFRRSKLSTILFFKCICGVYPLFQLLGVCIELTMKHLTMISYVIVHIFFLFLMDVDFKQA